MSNSHHHIPGSVYNLKFRPFGTFILRSPHSTADLAVGERTSDLELRAHLEQLEPLLCTPTSGRRITRNLGTFWTSSPPDFNYAPWMYAFGVDGFSSGIHSSHRRVVTSACPTTTLIQGSRVRLPSPLCLRTFEHLISCTQRMA